MITVITGPPCSGKSTYVRERAKPGDVIIDFDVIAQALGSPEDHDHDPRLREITAAAWSAAVDRLATGYSGMSAWIVDSRPSRMRLVTYQRARASIIALDAPPDELHRRATVDGRSDDAHQRIDQWAARHGSDPQPRASTRW